MDVRVLLGGVLSVYLLACGGTTQSRGGSPDEPDGSGGGGGSSSLPEAGRGSGGAGAADAGVDEAITERSGAQVTVREWFSDGAPLFRKELWDEVHRVACTVQRAEDGEMRCLPASVASSHGVVFLDENCTEPVVRDDPPTDCGEPPRGPFVGYASGKACPEPETFTVKKGKRRDAPAKFYGWNGPLCWEQTPQEGEAFYEAEAAPPQEWTRFERSVVAVTNALGVEMWSGAEGARLQGELRLLPEDVACAPDTLEGVQRCVPSRRVQVGHEETFADAACTVPLFASPECELPDLLVETSPSDSSCASPRFFALGAAVPNSGVSWTWNGPCEPAAQAYLEGFEHHRRGEEIPPDRYPRLQMRVHGSGAPARLVWVSEGKELTGAGSTASFDGTAATTCGALSLADGGTVCVSSYGGFGPAPLFADARCTEPLYVVTGSPFEQCGVTRAPEPLQWVDGAVTNGPGCWVTRSVRRVEARYEGPVYSRDGACKPVPTDGESVYYRLGPERGVGDVFPRLTAGAL